MLTTPCVSELKIQNHYTNLYNIKKIELLKEITPSNFFPHINSWAQLNVLDHKRTTKEFKYYLRIETDQLL